MNLEPITPRKKGTNMSTNTFLTITKRHFDLALQMLTAMIDGCPEDLWQAKHSQFVFWQQILHALTGINFWMRLQNEPFQEPFAERKVYPELDHDPATHLSKAELTEYAQTVQRLTQTFFADHDDAWLVSPAAGYAQITNLDVIMMQIRHIQYHVGHCNSILREQRRPAVAWIDFLGEAA
jgi:hypothetical protein